MKKIDVHKIWLGLVVAVSVFMIGSSSASQTRAEEDALWIALVGPLSGPSADVGREMVQSVQLALDSVNSSGGVQGRQVRLQIFDDQNDAKLARQRAQEIVDGNQALVVIGHNTSDASAAGGALYQQHGIPAISGSATADAVTVGNEWYFRTIFDNSTQANYIANYLYRILGHETASIIFTDDRYGRTLADSFEKNFSEIGGSVRDTWRVTPDAVDREGAMKAILDELETTDAAPEMLFLAMSAADTQDFVSAMGQRAVQYPLFGSDAIGSSAFAQQFADYTSTDLPSSDNPMAAYAAVPLIFDSANAQAQALHDRYLATYGEKPSWRTATFYDATMIAIEAMRHAEVVNTTEERAADRARIRNRLADIDSASEAYWGATGPIFFDAAGNAQIPVAVGLFQDRQLISAPVQLQAVVNLDRPGLQQDIAEGRVFQIQGQLVDRAQIVYTGVEFIKVGSIDQMHSTYTMDFYLWFRYPDSVDATDIEFVNAAETVRLGRAIQEAIVGDLHYKVFRVSGEFKGEFEFHDYPFDSQRLPLDFRHAELTRDQIIYAVDMIGGEMNDSITRLGNAGVFDTVTNWQPVAVHFSQDTTASDSSLGNPSARNGGRGIEFSRFSAEIQIKRNVIHFVAKNLLPVLLIVIALYLSMYIAPDQINPRMTIGVNGLLTNAFFLVTLSNNLPEIGYTVAIEYVFYFVFLLAIIVIVTSLLTYNAQKDEDQRRMRRLIWTGHALYLLMIFTFTVVFGFYYDLFSTPWA